MERRPQYKCVHCDGLGYREGMTEREALEYAKSGRANYATDRLLTQLGLDSLWTLEKIGEEPVPGHYVHGGFWVDREGVFQSRLTESGNARLRQLS